MKKILVVIIFLVGFACFGIFHQCGGIRSADNDIPLQIGSLGLQCKLVRADIKSKTFHQPGCRYFNCRYCTKAFPGRHEAIKAGYVPCELCKP